MEPTWMTRLCGAIALAALLANPRTAEAQGAYRGSRWGAPDDFAATVENGKRLAGATCASCHGPDGNSSDPQYPKLAGQNPAYVYRQLADYQAGVRRSEIMTPMTDPLSLADMADLATFYSRQSVRPDAITDSELADAGRRIFLGFRPGPAPACAACHGSAGAEPMGGHGMMGGMRADTPRLAGQHATYVVAQLDQFENGRRPSTVMGRFAAMLTREDKRAVAEYVAGLR